MQLGFVFVGDDATGRTKLRKLNRHIEERTAAIARTGDVGSEPFQVLAQLLPRLAGVRRSHLVPVGEEIPMLALQERGYEIILGREPAIEAGFRGTGFGNDGVNSDRANAVTVK